MKYRPGLALIALLLFSACMQVRAQEGESILPLTPEQKRQFDSLLVEANRQVAEEPENADAFAYRGMVRAQLGDFESGVKDMNRAIELEPDRATAYMHRGMMYLGLGEERKSIDNLEEAVLRDPDLEEAWAYLDGYFGPRYLDKELESVARRSLERNEGSWHALRHLGSALYRQKRFDEADAVFDRMIEIDSENDIVWALKADIWEKTGPVDSLMFYLERALEYAPDDTDYLGNIAYLKGLTGDFEGALDLYERLIELSDVNPYIFNNYGYALFKTGENEEAIQMIAQSLRMDPSNSYAYRNLALIHIDDGNMEMACEQIERALKLGFTERYGEEMKELQREHCR